MGRIVGLCFQPAKFACPHCGKEYASEKTLASHIAKEHAEPEKEADKE